jgi:hypothetical protein
MRDLPGLIFAIWFIGTLFLCSKWKRGPLWVTLYVTLHLQAAMLWLRMVVEKVWELRGRYQECVVEARRGI